MLTCCSRWLASMTFPGIRVWSQRLEGTSPRIFPERPDLIHICTKPMDVWVDTSNQYMSPFHTKEALCSRSSAAACCCNMLASGFENLFVGHFGAETPLRPSIADSLESRWAVRAFFSGKRLALCQLLSEAPLYQTLHKVWLFSCQKASLLQAFGYFGAQLLALEPVHAAILEGWRAAWRGAPFLWGGRGRWGTGCPSYHPLKIMLMWQKQTWMRLPSYSSKRLLWKNWRGWLSLGNSLACSLLCKYGTQCQGTDLRGVW